MTDDWDDRFTKIMRQVDEFQETHNKSPDDIVMNSQTFNELKKELRADDPQSIYRTTGINPYGINVSTIMGIQIYINEAIPSGQMFFRSQGAYLTPVILTNIGKPSKLSRFAKKRMIRIE